MKQAGGIIKTVKKEDPYVRIFNSVFTDNRMSFKAKGILGYLLSKPNNWETNIKDLYRNSVEGYGSIRSGITELQITGYMELKNVWDENQKAFTGRFYIVREEPLLKTGFRMLENKNKSFSESETILEINPLGDKKVLKTINDDNHK